MTTPAISNAIKDARHLIQHLESLSDIPFSAADHTTPRSAEYIANLDVLIQAIRGTIHVIEDSFAEIIKARNFIASPINQLPLELLIKILDLSITGYDRVKNVQRLMPVCRYWKQIFRSTPSFWTRINCNGPPALVRRAINLSSPLPVDFDYSKSSWGPYKSYNIVNFWEDVLPVMDRCRSLRLTVDHISDIKSLEGRSAPVLEELSINMSPLRDWWPMAAGEQGSDLIDVFGGDAPKLQVLKLDGIVWIPWQSQMLVELRELRIQNMGRAGPSISDLIAILRRSPQLEVLQVDDHDRAGTFHDDPIDLPALGNLDLGRVPETLARHLMTNIRSPRCQFFSITLTSETPLASTVALVLKHVLNAVQPVAKSGRGVVKVVLNPPSSDYALSAISFVTMGNSYEIRFALSPVMVTDRLHTVIDTVTAQLSDFEIHVDQMDESDEGGARFLSCLSRLPHVSNLTINHSATFERILDHLTSPYLVDGAMQWAVPELSSLWCGDGSHEHLDNLLQMVRSRYGKTESDSGPVATTTELVEELPMRLDKLSIYAHDYDMETWAEIGRIIGADHTEVVEPW